VLPSVQLLEAVAGLQTETLHLVRRL
jgi:hypothetical protein